MSDPKLAFSAKIDRASAQIGEVKKQIRLFLQSRPFAVTKTIIENGTKELWSFKVVREVPTELALIVGETLHNLRSVLDQTCSAIALKNGKTESGVAYPFGKSEVEFLEALAKQSKIANAHDVIKAARPYSGPQGDHYLFSLHELNKRDKHRCGLVPIAIPGTSTVSKLTFWQGLPFVVGDRAGKFMHGPASSFSVEQLKRGSKPQAVYDVEPGMLNFTRLPLKQGEDLEFMITSVGAEFETDFSPAIRLEFDSVGLDAMPAEIVLERMGNSVRGQIEKLTATCLT